MCGIFGSRNAVRFQKLLELNSERGEFATGLMIHDPNAGIIVKKQPGKSKIHFNRQYPGIYFTGHVQAPTSSQRSWQLETTHPFVCISWAVMHNGVLTNHEELIAKYKLWNVNPVDTSVIPQLIQVFMEESLEVNPVGVIKKVLEELEGTFSLCICDIDTKEFYLARQGSLLHTNSKGDFSTVPISDGKVVEEGTILQYSNKKWVEVEKFKTNSPFLFL